MDELGKNSDSDSSFLIPTPESPYYPDTFRTIGAASEGGDIFGPSPLSCVLLENIPREQVQRVETRTLPVSFVVRNWGMIT